ncbi:hypothetical protein GDO78_000946 [Eleutherodactylus coqui]|nr:hypothetical protein GDO78_000946 [Eleutherodactylus coqui]
MESMLSVVDGEVPLSLKKCFAEGEKVNYEKFRNWLLQNKDAFTFSRWLLSGGVFVTLTDDSDTPTFYQTLAGVTHLEESDIIDLEKRYWLLKAQSRTGRFDLETFVPLISPPIHQSLSEVCFKVFDIDRDGVLSRTELEEMVLALLEVWKDNRTDAIPELHLNLSDIIDNILKSHDTTKESKPVVIEPSPALNGSRYSLGASSLDQREDDRTGTNVYSTTEEKSFDNISSASEVSESTTNTFLYSSTSGADMCFARQHNTSDNNNQSMSGSNGSILIQLNPQKPGAIDNQPLVTQENVKVPSLTLEGGRLKQSPSLLRGKDYEIVPEPVWRALYHWYGANLSLPRPPVLRYVICWRGPPTTEWPVIYSNVPSPNAPLKRVLAYTGCFSRMQTIKEIHEYLSQRLRIKEEDMRLWLYNSENYLTLLDDEDHKLEYLKIQDEQHLVIEVRNKDMSWPEEMSFIANSSKIDRHKVPTEKGATGLSNLGNTCFMNSSIQCVSNTQPLTKYFISGRHLYELNRTNPIGMKGHMAKCYGDLVQELWSGTQKNVAPLKLRWTIAKYAPRFNGFQQQDSQELLAFLLDGLHEDLNRVHEKPYVELKDSDGRPDWEVAAEAWDNHLRRNRSIVVDLFHGQLRSQVKCKTCGHVSVRFDPFNFLSLPLPMDSYMHLEITVIKLDGTTPVRYGLRLNMDEKYTGLKKQLSELCGLKPEQILLAEVHGSNIKNFPQDNQKVRLSVSGFLCAFEIPIPGSPTSASSPTPQDPSTVPSSNGHQNLMPNGGLSRPPVIPNGMPNTVVPCGTEKTMGNGVLNGHISVHPEGPFIGYIIAIHRKMRKSRSLAAEKNCEISARKALLQNPRDDSMGYQYPFTLRVVQKDGNSCASCPWYRFCRGCKIDCTEDRAYIGNAYIAVDWDPTALHLRYQTSQERIVEEHESVEQSRRAQAEPINLDSCLRAFTTEEELGEDEMYYCSKCKTHCLATKKLDLWRLPPILIIHLKRFQFVNGRWIKSQKIVKFPREKFDPSAFLVPRGPVQYQKRKPVLNCEDQAETRSTQGDLKKAEPVNYSPAGDGDVLGKIQPLISSSTSNNSKASPLQGRKAATNSSSKNNSPNNSPKTLGRGKGRLRLPQLGGKKLSSSKENLDQSKDNGSDNETRDTLDQVESSKGHMLGGNQTELAANQDTQVVLTNGLNHEQNTCNNSQLDNHIGEEEEITDDQREDICCQPIYNLYAISCHSGIMGGGHYVTYAKNPNDKWYCYNDSSCKELHPDEIDTDSAYILFYEQQGVDYAQFLPKIDGKKMADTSSMDEDFESDYKKYCVLQ